MATSNNHPKRGPYKRYLYDPDNYSIPKSTAYEERKRLCYNNDNNDKIIDCNKYASSYNKNMDQNDVEENQIVSDDCESMVISECDEDDVFYDSFSDLSELMNSLENSEHEISSTLNQHQSYEDITNDEYNIPYEPTCDNDNIEYKASHKPMYEGCRITKKECEILILSFAVRHNISDAGIGDLLTVINTITPHSIFPSLYLFLKNYDVYKKNKKIYYCAGCNEILKDESYVTGNCFRRCFVCQNKYEKAELERDLHFFIHVSIIDQLKDFVKSSLYDTTQKYIANNTYYDVPLANYYKSLQEDNIICEGDLTLQLNSDGISPTKSSSYSMWPIQLMINELPFTIRRKHIFLCGLWYNRLKPPMDLFLKLTVQELIELQKNGIEKQFSNGDVKIIKFHLIMCNVDSVARPMIQNIHQYNGECGCTYCIIPGEAMFGSRIYYVRTNEYPLRTRKQYLKDCRIAINDQKMRNGVKGPCILALIPTFDPSRSWGFDVMHTVLLGVTKTFVEAWFNSCNHTENWYIGRQIDGCDEILLNIKTPIEITRAPRTLRDRARWKSHEWRSFLLYYSYACITGINMPREYVRHWSLLIYAIFIYCKPKYTEQENIDAERSIRKFVDQVGKLYGLQYYKYNVHMLLHIPKSCSDFGALWATSNFPYENFNGYLNKLTFSFNGVSQQIVKRYYRYQKLQQDTDDLGLENLHIFGNIFNFPLAMYEQKISTANSVKFSSISKRIVMSLTLKVCIQEYLHMDINESADHYNYCVIGSPGIKFHHSSNNELIKRSNCYGQLKDGKFVKILNILKVYTKDLQSSFSIIACAPFLEPSHCKFKYANTTMKKIYTLVELQNTIMVTNAENLENKCILAPFNNCNNESTSSDETIIIPLVNNFERD